MKISGEAGMHRIVSKQGRTIKVRKEFEDGRRGMLKEFDVLEVSYSAGRGPSHDDGKVVQAMSWNSIRLEQRLEARRKARAKRKGLLPTLE